MQLGRTTGTASVNSHSDLGMGEFTRVRFKK